MNEKYKNLNVPEGFEFPELDENGRLISNRPLYPVEISKMVKLEGYPKKHKLTLELGLSCRQQNSDAYFSACHSYGWVRNDVLRGGIAGLEIFKHFPEVPIEFHRLHLCDLEGTPLHAHENGVYFLERINPAFKPSKLHCRFTHEKALKTVERHFGASISELKEIIKADNTVMGDHLYLEPTEVCDAIIKALSPKWKLEAEKCLKWLFENSSKGKN